MIETHECEIISSNRNFVIFFLSMLLTIFGFINPIALPIGFIGQIYYFSKVYKCYHNLELFMIVYGFWTALYFTGL